MRAALRPLARRPGLSATIILTLALAIGANSAIFSAVDAVLLQPLPFPSADRLVAVYERNRALRQATQLVAPGRLEEWNARNHTFDHATPTGPGYDTNGAPAPPRDGLSTIGDLYDLFDFDHHRRDWRD